MVCVLCGVPYIIGLFIVLPNDFPPWKLSSNRKSSLTTTKFIGEDSFLRYLKKYLRTLLICKSLWICLLMMFFYQFAGYTLVVSFAGKLLKQESTHPLVSTSNLTSNEMNPSIITTEFLASLEPALLSACLVAIAGLIGVILGVILVQMSFDRRKILLGSAFGTVVTFAALGIYNMTIIIDPKDIQLIPTICLVLHVLLFNVGYGPLCFALMAEILPSHIKTLKMSIVMIFGGIFGFLNLKSFSLLENYLDNGPIYLLYAGVNLIGFIYLKFFLPHTDQSPKN